MNPNATPETVPFRVMRSTLKTMQALALMAITASELAKTNQLLSAKALVMHNKTSALKNPTRRAMMTHNVAWYMLLQEIAEAVRGLQPELAHNIQVALVKTVWLSTLVGEYKKVTA